MHNKHILIWVIFAIIMLVFFIVIMAVCVKKKTFYPMLALIITTLIILIILLIWKVKSDEQWMVPKFEAIPLVSFSNVSFVPIDTKWIEHNDYHVFNPNGIKIAGPNEESKEIIMTMRASNNKDSYPLLQIFEPDMNKIVRSGKVIIHDKKPILQPNQPQGYEDMRLFHWNDGLYMIGVNIDRNPRGLPSMVLVKLKDLEKNFQGEIESESVLHLTYKPLEKKPNKNWSPIALDVVSKEKTFGFVVNIDPLLIVKFDPLTGICTKTHEKKKQLTIREMRNSTISYRWKEIPANFQQVFNKIQNPNITYSEMKYLMMGHTKYVESDHNSRGKLILYRHYFVVIDLADETVHASNPFYVESAENPHIEYISGFFFNDKNTLTITYGLQDRDSKYLKLSATDLEKLLELSSNIVYQDF